MKANSDPKRSRLAQIMRDSWRYWELRRLAYNAALLLGALGWLILTWPHFRPAMNLRDAGAICVLALLANLCYCAVYLADIPAQFSSARSAWLQWRWSALVCGILFALLLEMYWIADEIYPYVGR